MSLHEELNSRLRHGQRESLHLNGLIRQLKSGQAMLMMKRDKANKELDVYVNKMSESLLDFRTEMLVFMQTELENKFKEIAKLREIYEKDIDMYMELCEEAEQMVQFGSSLSSVTDKRTANRLIEAFRVLLDNVSDSSKLQALVKFEFHPALPVDSISSSMFGELIRGAGSKLSRSPLSPLGASKRNLDMYQAADSVVKERSQESIAEKNDQSTQTDTMSEHATKYQCDQNTVNSYVGYSGARCDQQQYPTYPLGSPPGLEYVTMPYCPFDAHTSCNPPPGFSAYPQPYQHAGHQSQPAEIQMNPCVLTGVPLYAQGASYQTHSNLAAPPGGIHFQNTNMYQCGVPVPSYSSSFYPSDHGYSTLGRKSCSIPITSPNSDSSTDHPPNERSKQGIVTKPEMVSIVNDIPLPMGPAPKESYKSVEHDKENANMKKSCVNLLDMDIASYANERDVKEKEVVESLEVEQPNKCTAAEARVDNYYTVNEPLEKCVKLEKKSDNSSAIEKFEGLLKRTSELLISNDISEINTVQRSDEVLPSTIDSKAQLKSCNVDRDLHNDNVMVCKKDIAGGDVCHGGIKPDRKFSESEKDMYLETSYKHDVIQNMDIDQMFSHIGQDLKEKLAEGRTIMSPIKPLRRPLRLPWNLLNESKSKVHPVHVLGSATDSSSEVQALGHARVNTEVDAALQSVADEVLKTDTLITHCIESEELYQSHCDFGKVMTNTDKNNNDVDADDEDRNWPDILDVSTSSCLAVRDGTKNEGVSRNKATQINKETLQAQTNWMKRYLKQRLPDCREQTSKDEEWDVKYIAEAVVNVKSESEIKVEDEREQTSMITKWDVKQTELFAKQIEPRSEIKVDVESQKVKDVNWTGAAPSVKEKWAINTELLDVSHKKADKVLEEMGTKESMKDASTEANCKENSDPSNEKNLPERRKDLSNLKNAVKGFLGHQKETSPRSVSTYSRLGALQAHWLKHLPGTGIRANLLFKCSSNMHFPIGVTTNSLRQIIVADTGNNRIILFDESGRLIRTFGEDVHIKPVLRRPSAIVVNEFDDIFVKDDISIRVFNSCGNYIMDIAKDVFSKPFGLVLTPAKCLLVLDTNWQRPTLVHVSQDGSRHWKYPYTPLINAPPGSKCRFIGVSENNVIVSDLGLSRIYVTNLEGLSLKVIGSYGNGFMEFVEPSGISVDNYGNIVIGDSKNNRIQVYRHDGSYTGLVEFDDPIVRPSGIHLASDNRLIVINFLHHIVKVYQLSAGSGHAK